MKQKTKLVPDANLIPPEFKMTQHEKVVRLVEGGFVWHDGHLIGAKKVTSNDEPCSLCKMDSLCNLEMTDLCGACECYMNGRYLLYLANHEDDFENGI